MRRLAAAFVTLLRLALPGGCLLAAFLGLACSRRMIEGEWQGGLPLPDAGDCSIRLESGGRLRFACGGDPRWSGFGRFRWEGDRLELQVETLLRGPARSDEVAPSWSGAVTGPGNQITWRLESGERYVWVRKPR